MAILELILLLVAFGFMLGLRASPLFATVTIGIYVLTTTLFRDWNLAQLGLAWVLYGGMVTLLHHHELRKRWLTGPILARFRAIMPPISRTEREALEAGTVWWEADLFGGQPDWNTLLDFPPPRLSEEEQAFLNGPVQTLCAMLDDWAITEEHRDLPPEVWQYLKDNGFFGMIIPKQYGGLEFSAYAHSTVVTTIATRSITAAVTVMVPNSLGPAELLLHYGTAQQKDHYLPRLADGRDIPCFALTAPDAGSDAAAMTDRGVVCRGHFQGRDDVLGIRLNWEKRYITLGPVATVLGLAFKLYDPEHLLGDEESLGITLALIPTDTAGVEIGDRHFPLNLAFQNGPNRGHDVFIPMDWIIGDADGVGQGWRMLMESLAAGRSISLPALSTGSGKLTSHAAGAYAAVRKQFKVSIGSFEGIQEALARIAANAYMMDAARGLTAAAVDSGERPSVASAIVKYHLTERMRQSVDDAMDVHGGRGICMGPHNYLGRIYQAIPISITVEGANILTRSLIIFGQGAIRCHPYLLAEMEAAQENDRSRFDRVFMKHVALLLSNSLRAFFHGLTGARFAKTPSQNASGRYFRAFGRMSAAFAVTAEVALLTLGGSLKRRESISARLGDVLSYLYLGSAVLKHYHDQDCQAEDWPLVQWNCERALYDMQQQLLGVLDNLPARPLAWLLRRLLFPWGPRLRPPQDALSQRVAAIIQSPNASRERLIEHLYLPRDPSQALAQLEQALISAQQAEPVLAKIQAASAAGQIAKGNPEDLIVAAVAAQVINEHEAGLVRTAANCRRQVIQVDAFEPAELMKEHTPWHKPAHSRVGQSM